MSINTSIDFEAFDHEKLSKDYSYHLRPANNALAGVVIEAYQAKHSPGWPGGFAGKKGTQFNLTLDETIRLAKVIINTHDLFHGLNPPNHKPPKSHLMIDRDLREKLGKGLFKKLQNQSIEIHAGFNAKKKSWEMHFFPQKYFK
jgi:hypothetical protein